MHDRDGNNGPLTNAGCHYYLLWQTVLQSRPQTVYAQGRVLAQGRPEVAHVAHLAIDTAVLTIAYESGDIATMTVSWGLAARCQLRGRPHRLFGPKGGVEGDLNAALQVYDHDRVETVQLPRKNLHQDELALFADALARGQPAPVGFVQGKEMLAVTLAILQSIATGEVVVVRGTPCA
jgi:predicted dehydrogenase